MTNSESELQLSREPWDPALGFPEEGSRKDRCNIHVLVRIRCSELVTRQAVIPRQLYGLPERSLEQMARKKKCLTITNKLLPFWAKFVQAI
ncbi:hypothetical protein PC116_g8542 [Phytophthora cactorum]|nr:hypothetical protein Pcac1_g9823 [Phytophthora cactorum]KAG3030519.1 hypothetical protein PC120_g3662 [Phytophthora cactorum]KAG3040633.1 hypothetical protein PC119_g1280 [Phytophthora cactorum]KAG3198125.1 hypothetical protein PC128_g6259 [Phytophthora cactorum]KAG4243598.1 hypothetical protein PC116_g8542 [Phytophthora cactorum]